VASIDQIRALRKKGQALAQPPSTLEPDVICARDAQQAAFQPSGNGINGQAGPLSFAARGGVRKIGK